MRQQFPVVLKNRLANIDNKTQPGSYDGYGGCPLTVANGKVLLAEFRYDGEVVPSFNLDPRKPRRAYWWLKKTFFSAIYWNVMLRGRDWQHPRPNPRPQSSDH